MERHTIKRLVLIGLVLSANILPMQGCSCLNETTFNVATYNVKHFEDSSFDYSLIATEVENNNIDVLCIQEVDSGTDRSNGHHQAKLLAEALGDWNYEFSPCIDFQNGQYGHAILSKYPIESYTTTLLESGGNEQRAFGHAVLKIKNRKINVINTHLSYENDDIQIQQIDAIAQYVEQLDNFVVNGDFNTNDYTRFESFKDVTLVNNAENEYPTFVNSSKGIDNIIVSSDFIFSNTKVSMVDPPNSDHRMLMTTLTLK